MTPAPMHINLLGRAEVLRARQRRRLMAQGTVSAGLGLVLATVWLAWQHEQLDQQRQRNAAQARELAALEPGVKEAVALQQALKVGNQRQLAWQGLAVSAAPAQGLVELAQALPPGVRFKHIQQDGDTLLVAGAVTSGERLTTLMTTWAAPERVWRRLELVHLAASVPHAVPVPSSPPSGHKASGEAPVAPLAQGPGELDFSIRLRREPVPALP